MENKKDWAFSARVQLYVNEKKDYLEFQLFTDTNSYKFDDMCHLINACKISNDVITDTDDGLTKEEKEKIKYSAQDFDKEHAMSNLKKVAQKHWQAVYPTNNFQIYVGSDYKAVENILQYFYKVVKFKQELVNQQNQEHMQ